MNKPKFYKPYGRIRFSSIRICGGGGGLSGECGIRGQLYFSFGGKDTGQGAGQLEFRYEMEVCQLISFTRHFADTSSKLVRAEQFTRALMTALDGIRFYYRSPFRSDMKSKEEIMLAGLGVEITYSQDQVARELGRVYRGNDSTTVTGFVPPTPQYFARRSGFEDTSTNLYDFLSDKHEHITFIQTGNVKNEIDEFLHILRQNRNQMLAMTDTLPSYFNWLTPRHYKKMIVPFVKLQEVNR